MNYNKIVNPFTNEIVDLNTDAGQKLLKTYLNVYIQKLSGGENDPQKQFTKNIEYIKHDNTNPTKDDNCNITYTVENFNKNNMYYFPIETNELKNTEYTHIEFCPKSNFDETKKYNLMDDKDFKTWWNGGYNQDYTTPYNGEHFSVKYVKLADTYKGNTYIKENSCG